MELQFPSTTFRSGQEFWSSGWSDRHGDMKYGAGTRGSQIRRVAIVDQTIFEESCRHV
jgi:hypothetical protein